MIENILIIVVIIVFIGFVGLVIYSVMKKENGIESIRPQYEKHLTDLNKRIEYYKKHNAIFDILDEYILIDEKSIRILDAGIIPIELYKTYITNNPNYTFPEDEYFLKDIKYYELTGSKHKEQNISGGGSSIKGAVAGGLIAGGTGAIIGSRKGIETSYKDVDDRKVIVTFNNSIDEYDNNTLELDVECYDKLLDYIPEKEYDNYIQNKKKKGLK